MSIIYTYTINYKNIWISRFNKNKKLVGEYIS